MLFCSLVELFVNKGSRLEIFNRLFPGVLEHADRNLVRGGGFWLLVHQQDALETVVDGEVAFVLVAVFLNATPLLVLRAQVLGLAELKVIKPRLG